ncbi:hypothetical protein CW304_22155 [Bacillus sp. UFRGS-B20]|nr:hypothetical protein CW304_22155 [Bacillus sp. UFRGS-B20]
MWNDDKNAFKAIALEGPSSFPLEYYTVWINSRSRRFCFYAKQNVKQVIVIKKEWGSITNVLTSEENNL